MRSVRPLGSDTPTRSPEQVARAHKGVDARAIAAEQLGSFVDRECRRGLDRHAAECSESWFYGLRQITTARTNRHSEMLLPTSAIVGSRI